MKKYGYIYKTTNLINNKIYIGQHIGKFNNNYLGSGRKIGQAIKNYGKNNFKVEFLISAKNKFSLDKLEKYYIKEYRKKIDNALIYNISDGGFSIGPFKHTEETKKKMSLSRMGHSVSKETRKKIGKANSIALKGKSLKHKIDCSCCVCRAKRGETKEQNKGQNNGMFGKHYKHTEKTKEKIRKTKAKYPYRHSKERREKIRKIMLGSKRGKYKRRKDSGIKRISCEIRQCGCNCNRTFECRINSKQIFIHGHNNRNKKFSIKHIRKIKFSIKKWWKNRKLAI